MIRAALAMLAAAAMAGGTFQEPRQPQEPQHFRSSADAVTVHVLVLDDGRAVGGLTAADFELRDSGVEQQIDSVQVLDVPFSMMLALDSSSSLQSGRRRLQEAARAAVETLHDDDRVSVLSFSEQISVPTPWSAPRHEILAAIDGLQPDGSTSLADAAFTAVLQRDPEAGRRNLVILLSDGDDTSSWLPDDRALEAAERSEAVVYTVAIDKARLKGRRALNFRSGVRLDSKQPVMRSDDFLEQLASRTGGVQLSTSLEGLQKTFRRVVNNFRSRYVLTYAPGGVPDGGWHSIDVRVRGRNYKVTARRGYQRQVATP
jgi:Ca-activated chloride channel family protein